MLVDASGNDFLEYDPAEMTIPQAYTLLLNCVSPRPIAFVSTLSADGISNLAPFSFFMAGGANPPSVAISPVSDRHGNAKHTLKNIEATGEYTINVVSYDIREMMNETSAEYPDGISEWDAVGFTAVKSSVVKPAIVKECTLSMEVKLFDIVRHGGKPLSANYVIGEVVRFHVDKRIVVDGAIDPTLVEYLGRMSGDWYVHATPKSMFALGRPTLIVK